MRASSGSTGIGWRHPHYDELLERRPAIDFIEVHSENFFAEGGAALALLAQARSHYPVSLHGVGLGLGSVGGIDERHLDQLVRLVERIEPVRVSDHACFARGRLPGRAAGGVHAADLLPIPFNRAALEVMSGNVQRAQERLGRPLLVENLSAYVTMPGSDLSETTFLGELSRRTGCGLLIDVNNIYVNALNRRLAGGQTDAEAFCRSWIDSIPPEAVGELHVAGHQHCGDIVIDDHGSRVDEAVWSLCRHALERFDNVPVLVEWDTDVPSLQVLLDEVARARAGGGAGGARMNAIAQLAQQQQRLLGAVLGGADDVQWLLSTGLPESLTRRGLQAYQSHGLALAERALSAAYPVVQQMIGPENFGSMAQYFWRLQPPTCSDMARWGDGLAYFLQAAPSLADEPFLGDVARVEWALHCAASAADAALDVPSFALLAAEPPAAPTLTLSPGVWLMTSVYPVVSLIEAHQLPLVQRRPALLQAADQLQRGTGEHALVWRQGFKPRVRLASTAEHNLLASLLAGQSLELALEQAASASADAERAGAAIFDFSVWLAQAVQDGLVTGAHVVHSNKGGSS